MDMKTLGGFARAGLAFIAGVVSMKGWASEEQVMEIGGALAAAGVAIWSWWSKRKA